MSIFGSIMSKIFHRDAASSASGGQHSAGAQAAPASTAAATAAAPSAAPPTGSGTTSATGSQPAVDVEAVLSGMAAKSSQQLDWRRSIVDLMKLLDLDSSLSARKQLAQELHYGGDTNDSATMNLWLHKQVMQKLAENGGKVPNELKA
jgi:hypothetical protein